MRGQGRALGAALFLLDLDGDFLAFAQLAGARLAVRALQIGRGDFLQRQKAVAGAAVVDKGRFETRLDAAHDAAVDVAFFLVAVRRLDIEVKQVLAIDDGHPQLFRLAGVEQDAFHREILVADA